MSLLNLLVFNFALQKWLSKNLNIWVTLKNKYNHIKKYCYQLVLLSFKLITTKDIMSDAMGNIPGLDINFLI